MRLCWFLILLFAVGKCTSYVIESNSNDGDSDGPTVRTDRPIIGVLAEEILFSLDKNWPGVYDSYIAASYIKFVEAGGARAVPIW